MTILSKLNHIKITMLYCNYREIKVWLTQICIFFVLVSFMKIIMVKDDESAISFKTGLAHYFLSVLPFAFVIYLVSYQVRHEVNFFKALTASEGNVFFGIIFVIWVQAHLFTKKRTTAYDLICKTVFINGRTSSTFPWKKKSWNFR